MPSLTEILPTLRGMPFLLKLMVMSIGTIVLWWLLWGTGTFGKAELLANPAEDAARPSSSTNPVNAPTANIRNNSGAVFKASPNAQVTINNNGATEQTLKDVISELKALKSHRGADLSKRFPLGYTLFTITGAKNFVPLDGEVEGIVDWNSGQQILAMSRTSMAIRLPRIVRPVTVESVSVNLERKKGALFRIDVGGPGETRAFIKGNPDIDGNIGPGFGGMMLSANPKYSICLEILDLEAWGDVLVLGVKPYDKTRTRGFQAIRVE
jgi:hypothetical protein